MQQNLSNRIQQFLSKLNKDTLILSPNRRLANTWQTLFAKQQSQNHHAWERPLILPLITWIEQCYQFMASADEPQLLKPWQEQFFWEKQFLIAKPDSHPIVITEWAKDAIQSFALCQSFQISLLDPAFREQESSQLFQMIYQNIQNLWREKNYISIHQLPDYLCQFFLNSKYLSYHERYFPKEIFFIGFQKQHLSPQFNTLISSLNRAGILTHFEDLFDQPGSFQLIQFHDLESQYQSVALHAKRQSEQSDCDFPIGCIFPNLTELRSEIETIFTDVFEDASLFNISAGLPLSKEPIIACALHLLSLTPETPLESWISLITSPFIGFAEQERYARAKLKKEIQANFPPFWTLQSFCQTKMKTHCPHLQSLLCKWQDVFHQCIGSSHESWLEQFSKILTAFGFPGDRSFNSREHQSIQEFRSIWHRILMLDQMVLEKNRKRVFFRLKDLTEQSIFQIKTPTAHVQILGTLEGAGMPFSHLWLCDIHDKNWPPAPKPNAFIPIRLQKKLQMPHATTERELSFCKELLATYLGQSPTGIISFASHVQDQLFKPSFLVRSLPTASPSELFLSIPPSSAKILMDYSKLECFIDENAADLKLNKDIQGGVRILEDQALCPFRAFAIHRCHAKSERQASVSLTPAQRGELLHRALESIWKIIKDQQQLLNLTPLMLDQLISENLNDAYLSLSIERPFEFIQIEKKRLHRFIHEWLSLEKMRPPFSVEHCELKKTILCGDLILNIRIDRIDQLDSGGFLLIDYKTQENFRMQSWFDERISDVQLPLYALQWSNCEAIAIAQIHGKKHCFHGISAQDIGLDELGILANHKDAPNWSTLILEWKKKLEKLAQDFIQGDARVYPKIKAQPCHTCHLQKFCRI